MNRALQECIYFQGFYPVDNKEIFMQGQHVKTDNTQSTLESFFGKIVARDDEGEYAETDSNRYVSSKNDMSNALLLTQKRNPILDNIEDYIGGVINIRGDGGCTDSASLLSLLLTCIAENRIDYFEKYLDQLIKESESVLEDYDNKGFDITFKEKTVDKNAFKAHIENLKEKMKAMSIKDFIDEFQNTAVEDLKQDSARLSWIALSRTMTIMSAKKNYGDYFYEYLDVNKDALKLDGSKSTGGVLTFCDENLKEKFISNVLMLERGIAIPTNIPENTIVMQQQEDGSLMFYWGENKKYSVGAKDAPSYVKKMLDDGNDPNSEKPGVLKESTDEKFIEGITKECGCTILGRCSRSVNTDDINKNKKAVYAFNESLKSNKQNSTAFMVSNGAHTNLALTKEFAVSLSEAIQKTDLKNISLAGKKLSNAQSVEVEKIDLVTEIEKHREKLMKLSKINDEKSGKQNPTAVAAETLRAGLDFLVAQKGFGVVSKDEFEMEVKNLVKHALGAANTENMSNEYKVILINVLKATGMDVDASINWAWPSKKGEKIENKLPVNSEEQELEEKNLFRTS